MPAESSSDRASFLSLADFGDEAVYTLAGGTSSLPMAGIFDDPTIDVTMQDVPTKDARPSFCCRSEDIPVGAKGGDSGDQLDIAASEVHTGGTYRVIDLVPDGRGMTLIMLGAI